MTEYQPKIVCQLDTDGLTLEPPPSDLHRWDGTQWQPDPAAELETAKAAKLAAAAREAQAFIDRTAGLDGIPEFEVQTWALQAAEAAAWEDDPDADTPLLDTIAAARQIPVRSRFFAVQ